MPGCASRNPFAGLAPASAYERYVRSLEGAGLDETALGREWIAAGRQSLEDAAVVTLPFLETGYLPPREAAAAAYRMDLRRGRRLEVEITFESAEPGRLFVDLFEVRDGGAPRRVASLETGAAVLTHTVDRDATYLLRAQPELLRGGRFTIVERTRATLRFPVPGLTASAVQSAFGAARDGGTRAHEGVDLFAGRGTPVVAVADGLARPGTNPLGGNVVWLNGAEGLTFYYAHLDRTAIEGTTAVRAGSVVGYIGNTGNARTTAPHLHFGVYDRGAIDPVPFLQPDDGPPARPAAAADRLGELVRVLPARTVVRAGPNRQAASRRDVTRSTLARVTGIAADYLRIRLPDGTAGYVAIAAVTGADKPMRTERLPRGTVIHEIPADASPAIEVLTTDIDAAVHGSFERYVLVRMPDARRGWVSRRARGTSS